MVGFFSLKLLIFVLFVDVALLLLHSVGDNWGLLLGALCAILPENASVAIPVLDHLLLTLCYGSLGYHAPSVFVCSLRSSSYLSSALFSGSPIALLHLARLSAVIVPVAHIRLDSN